MARKFSFGSFMLYKFLRHFSKKKYSFDSLISYSQTKNY